MNRLFCVIGVLMALSIGARAFAEDCFALKGPERTVCDTKQLRQQGQKDLDLAIEKELAIQKERQIAAAAAAAALADPSKWQQSNQVDTSTQAIPDNSQDTAQQEAELAAKKARDEKAKASGGWYFGY
jgi:hypothetical protein